MSYTGRVDNLTIQETSDGVSITTKEPGWGGANEPRYHETTVVVKHNSIPNLIEALRDVQNARNTRW